MENDNYYSPMVGSGAFVDVITGEPMAPKQKQKEEDQKRRQIERERAETLLLNELLQHTDAAEMTRRLIHETFQELMNLFQGDMNGEYAWTLIQSIRTKLQIMEDVFRPGSRVKESTAKFGLMRVFSDILHTDIPD